MFFGLASGDADASDDGDLGSFFRGEPLEEETNSTSSALPVDFSEGDIGASRLFLVTVGDFTTLVFSSFSCWILSDGFAVGDVGADDLELDVLEELLEEEEEEELLLLEDELELLLSLEPLEEEDVDEDDELSDLSLLVDPSSSSLPEASFFITFRADSGFTVAAAFSALVPSFLETVSSFCVTGIFFALFTATGS